MKVISAKHISQTKSVKAIDCFVDNGYWKSHHGSMPDVDQDYASDKREDVKRYIESRYNHDGKQRVFSAGTFTTLQVKAVITDVCRIHRVSPNIVKYITAIIGDEVSDWTSLMRLAAKEKKVRDFIQKHPDVFEEIAPIMFQPRAMSVHASAIITCPDTIKGEDVECFDIIPIRKMNGMLVSELSGYDLDDLGLLKNDVLATKELSRLDEMIDVCNKEYNAGISLESLSMGKMDDPLVYDIFNKGLTQGIFQFASKGMTKFAKDMSPDCFDDLVAAAALFRPATLNSGAAKMYVDAKNGITDPEYLWGTYDILKNTYGVAAYQEQYAALARKIGNLSLGEGVNLVKAISKKKVDKIRKFKDKFYAGAKANGCPEEVTERIWKVIEGGAQYGFNRSHSVAYSMESYAGAYIKAHYPVAFYTVLLKWVKDENLVSILQEIRQLNGITISQPDINISGEKFTTNYSTNEIYWSILRIKQVGLKAVDFIVAERNRHGEFTSLEDFIKRIFRNKFKKYKDWDDIDNDDEFRKCPVTALTVKNLILAGAFDKLMNVGSITERYGLMAQAAELLGFKIDEKLIPEDLRDKHWFWGQKQIALTGFGAIDYERIYRNTTKPTSLNSVRYFRLEDLQEPGNDKLRVAICATIMECTEHKYKDKSTGETKHYGKVTLQQNIDTGQLTIWNDAWIGAKDYFWQKKDRIVIFQGVIKWSDYDEQNVLQINKGAFVMNI